MVVQHASAEVTEGSDWINQLGEDGLRWCVDGMRDGLAILVPIRDDQARIVDFRFRYVNPAGAALNQISVKTHLAHTLLELFPQAVEGGVLGKFAQVIEGGAPLVADAFPYTDLVGGHELARVYDLRAARLEGLLGLTWRDVTDAVETDRQSRRTAALIESSHDAIVVKTLDGVILTWNPGAERLYGYPAEEMIGRSVTTLQLPDRAGEIQALLDRIATGERIAHHETVRTTKDGTHVDVSLSISPVHDAEGRLTGACEIARDITERKRAETVLRDSEIYHRGLIEASLDGLVTVGPEMLLTDANKSMCELTGYHRAELIGSRFPDHFTDPDRAAEGVRLALREGAVEDYALTLRAQDGDEVAVSFNATTYTDDDGTTKGVFVATRDVTERVRAEKEILHLNAGLEDRVRSRTAALERSNSDLESFAYSVSHDLRTPLRAVSGFAEALLEDYGDALDETARGYTERICGASQRMAALIDDLLYLSRVARAQPQLESVDLSQLARHIVADLRTKDPARAVTVTIADGVVVRADRGLIRTVLENLIDNAWKFTAKRADAHIEFGARLDSSTTEVSCYVRDNGAGFDPAYTDKLFHPFQRLHAMTDFPGNGVGLASVRRTVELHGGRTWAVGAVDQGATISFTLPAPERHGD